MSGSSGHSVISVARDSSPFLSTADQQNVSSILSGSAWSSGTTITYSFPTSSIFYGTSGTYSDLAPFNGFAALSAQQQGESVRAFSLVASYTNLTFTQITETSTVHAAVRLANSLQPPTAYAYYPSTSKVGGDVFFGQTGKTPVMGNFDSGQAVLHEIGHALGLKHGQDNNTYGVMNANRLDIEFSLMNYPNYIGQSTNEGGTASTSEQSYMMYDIAALQYMYGANFNQVGHNNTYTWSSTTGVESINGVSQGTPVNNHIFETIWTAGATSTYDLSNFTQNQVDDMNPGGWMLFSTAQLADLNANAPSKPSGEIFARGDIYNALQYNNDVRSLITNIVTGTGSDTVTGNVANNSITGGKGNDTLDGGLGHDTAAFNSTRAQTSLINNHNGTWTASGLDGTDTLRGIEVAHFSDGDVQLAPTKGDLNDDGHSDVVLWNSATGGVAGWAMSTYSITAGSVIATAGTTVLTPGTGDINGDGHADIILQNGSNGDIAAWEMNGLSILAAAVISSPGIQARVVGVGDLNGDGYADIVLQNSVTGDVAAFEMNGTSIIAAGLISSAGTQARVVGIGDLNGDGHADIILQNAVTGDIAAFEMNGTSIGFAGLIASPGNQARVVGIGDLNGDGHADIILQNSVTGDVAAFEMNGTVIGFGALIASPGTQAQVKSVGDINGDGHADIILQNGTNGVVAAWTMNGPTITGAAVITSPGTDWHVIV